MLTLNDGRAELWQWDTGRTLSVDADCSQVHFSNKVFGRSIDVDVIDGVAIIPDILLQTDKDLNVWAFVGTADNGYTKISKTFNVNRRNKPADYVFTPTDQMTLQTIQRQIGDLADLTTEEKENLVAAINESAASGGGSSDAVLYTTQTLTDAQKKQARENIDATASDFIINGYKYEDEPVVLDKTFSQIKEAVQAGKRAIVQMTSDGNVNILPLIVNQPRVLMFSSVYNSENRIFGLSLMVTSSGVAEYFISTPTNNLDGTMPQVNMAASPTEAMQIATKKYVDDHATVGPQGPAGAPGITPTIGQNGNWYLGAEDTGKPSRGEKGEKGDSGTPGAAGHTPVKGTDYWTATDKAEIVAEVTAALPKYGGESE